MNTHWRRAQPGPAPPSRGTKCEARQAGAGGDTRPCYFDSLPPSPAARHSCVAGQDRAGSCPGGWNGNLTTWAGIRLRYLSSFRPRPRSRSRSTRSPSGSARCSCAGSVTPITPVSPVATAGEARCPARWARVAMTSLRRPSPSGTRPRIHSQLSGTTPGRARRAARRRPGRRSRHSGQPRSATPRGGRPRGRTRSAPRGRPSRRRWCRRTGQTPSRPCRRSCPSPPTLSSR